MRAPEYTLKQAIKVYEMIANQYYKHMNGGCEQCIGWFAEGPHCAQGRVLMLMHNKWIERMKRVAELEGVKMTFPTPITERISKMKHLPGHIKLIIFDVDGTLTTTKSGETFRKTADDWQWLPGRIETLQALHEQGVKIALATNQGGVAFGYMTAHDIAAELNQMAKEAPISDIEVCFTYPKAKLEEYRSDSDRRKPGPGMLMTIMYDAQIGPIHTLMIGDRPEDEQAAQAAGVAFQWANEFFGE